LSPTATVTITKKVPLDTTLSPINSGHIFHTPFLQHDASSSFIICTLHKRKYDWDD